MKYILLQSKDKQLWFVNCKLGRELLVGYGYIGFVSFAEQELYTENGKYVTRVTIPGDVLNQYGCSQFNFKLSLSVSIRTQENR